MRRSLMVIARGTIPAFMLTLGIAAWSLPASPDDSPRRETLVKGATIWTVSDAGTFVNGDLLIRDGKIVAVASSIDLPRGATLIDGTGRHVTPGLIDAHSHTAVDGNVNEGSNNITAEVRIGDVLDADDIGIYRELAGGLTAANVLHGSANSIGGQNQVIKLKWGVEPGDLKVRGARAGIKFALGENPKGSNFQPPAGTPRRYPATRMGVEESIRERFLTARQYEKDWDAYNALKPKEQARRVPPRRDLQVEAIEQVLRKERLVHSHCYRQDEILMILRLAEEFGFRVATLQHVLEGYKVADEIAQHGAGASTFSDWWAYKLEAHDAIPHNGTLMTDRGVVVSFNSDSDELARRMNLEAAKAIKYGGMKEEEAIKLVTINPAKQLQIDRRVGSLEPGKDADFVIWSGHPFSVYSVADQTWVDGTKQFDRAEDLAGRAGVESRRAALIAKVKLGDKPPKKDEAAAASPTPATPAAAPIAAAPASVAGSSQSTQAVVVNPEWRDRLAGTGGTIAITGATIHTVSGEDIERGTVVFKDGVIVAVSRDPMAPRGATLVKGDGLHLYPGMIDPSTVVGLTEIGSVAGSVDTSESGKINPNIRVEVAVNPESDLIPVTRANGITHVLTAPRGGLFAGTSALIRLDGWTWEDLTAAAPVAMHVNYPAWPNPAGGRFSFGPAVSDEDQKKRRDEDLKEMKDVIEAARAYLSAKAAGSPGLKPDPVLEAMAPVLDGTIPVIVAASEVRQIRDAVEWAGKEKLRMILETSADAWRVADLLKAKDIPVIVGPILSNSFRRDEPYDTAYSMPAKLYSAGIRFCIMSSGSSFGASSTRNLPYHAGMAAAFGLPRDIALKSVTLFPAQILGVGDRLGSIEKGKSASLILTDGDPLEIRTRILKEWIDGREIDLGNRHQRLYDKYRGRPKPPAAGASAAR